MIDVEQEQDAQRLFERHLLMFLVTATVLWNGALLFGAFNLASWVAEQL